MGNRNTLKRTLQFGRAIQTVAGVGATLIADDFAGNYSEVGMPKISVGRYDRNIQKGSLSSLGIIAGSRRIESPQMTLELTGGDDTTAAPWHTDLKACGFQAISGGCKKVEVGDDVARFWKVGDLFGDNATQASATKTGYFGAWKAGSPDQVGYLPLTGSALAATDTIYNYTQAGMLVMDVNNTNAKFWKNGDSLGNNTVEVSATKTATFVGYVAGSPNRIAVFPGTGSLASGDVLSNYTTLNTGTTTLSADPDPADQTAVDSVPAAAGHAFRPVSETDSTVPVPFTFEVRGGGQQWRAIDAFANGTLMFGFDKAALLQVQYFGFPEFDPSADGRPISGNKMTGIPEAGVQPLMCKGVKARIDRFVPNMTKLDLALNNTLAPSQTITDSEVVNSGYDDMRITSRDLSASVDPKYDASNGQLDASRRAITGSLFVFGFAMGAVDHGNGLIACVAPSAQFKEDPNFGDREGLVTLDTTIGFTGTDDDEVYVMHLFM